MSGKGKPTRSRYDGKAKWVKPAVMHIRAGSAEVGTGTTDDGDPGTALNNS